MLLLVFIISSLLKENAHADVITSLSKEQHVFAKADVTLSCNYSGTVRSLQWYRQYPGSKPENIILFFETSPKSDLSLRLTAAADKKVKQMNLTISSTEVKDSAMYYCALNAGQKLFFGNGTKLLVQTKQKKKADVYQLENSCLATDFTDHTEVNFTKFGPVRYSGKQYETYYSSFALNPKDKCDVTGGCTGESTDSSGIEMDEKINFMSLGLFWLRILFLKTVVFNMLMTFKAWMS